jgi:eukaryotic-like serine/threonine-protein kinase
MADDDAPTQAESPAARLEERSDQPTRQSVEPHDLSSAHSATAERAIKTEQLLRARGFGRLVTIMCLASLAAMALIVRSGAYTPRWLQLTMAGSLLLCGLNGLVVWLRIERTHHPQHLMRAFGLFCLAVSLSVQLYGGVFSPAPMVIALGVSYFGLGDDRSFGYFICVSATTGYAALATLVTVGVLPDVGLFPARDATVGARVAAVGISVGVFAVMLWQARLSRLATIQAVDRLDDALRLVQEREALINEANQNLEVALAAGGRRGAFSGGSAGAYRLGELLGHGGMGDVYAAAHLQTGRTAAVKLVHGKALANPSTVQRFLREAEVAMRLKSPSLVEIFELGEAESGAPFLAMELLVGHDLGWHLRRQRQLPLNEVVGLVGDVADGLMVAHGAGVVHRDLKPANLFRLDDNGRWKILYFGVAKLRGSTGTLTRHAIIGTPGYMSPEQAQGHDVDARSDLFSLGAVIYRTLTGRPPFAGPDTPQVLFDIVYRMPARPSELVGTLPPAVDAVLAIAMAKDRADRFASADELARAFAAAAKNELAEPLRKRSRAVLKRLPWGGTLKPA